MKISEAEKQTNEQIDRLWQIMRNKVVEDKSHPHESTNRFTISANTFNTANPMADKLNKDMNVLIEMKWLQLLDNQSALGKDKDLVISFNRIYGLLNDGRRAAKYLNKSDFAAKIRRHLDNKKKAERNKKWGDFWKLALAAIAGGIVSGIFVWIVSEYSK